MKVASAIGHLLLFGTILCNASKFALERREQPGTPACTTAPADPRPTHFRCNAEGRLDFPDRLGPSTTVPDQQSCRDPCLDNPGCISFSYNTGSGKCTLYSRSVNRQGFSRSTTSGTYFWNRACYSITCTCPSTERTLCDGVYCANLNRDPNNCGSCGAMCAKDEVCYRGSCQPVSCTNVIDCANGISGRQSQCGNRPNCFCGDVDGSSTVGICTDSSTCPTRSQCDTSDDCRPGYFCSLNNCCFLGHCKRMLDTKCANPASAQTLFTATSPEIPNRGFDNGVTPK